MFERSVVQSSRPSQMSTEWDVPGQPATHNKPIHNDILLQLGCKFFMHCSYVLQLHANKCATIYILHIKNPISKTHYVRQHSEFSSTYQLDKMASENGLWLTAPVVVAGPWRNDDWICQNRTHTAWIGLLRADGRPLVLAVRKDIKTTWAASDLCGRPGHAYRHMPHTDPPTDEPRNPRTETRASKEHRAKTQQHPSNVITNSIIWNRTVVNRIRWQVSSILMRSVIFRQ